MDLIEEGIYSDYDFYDYDKVEKIHEKHIRRQVQLRMKIREAEAKGVKRLSIKLKKHFETTCEKVTNLSKKQGRLITLGTNGMA